MKGKLYLIPTLLGDGDPSDVLPENVLEITRKIRYFIVEELKTARRFLSKIKTYHKIDDISFFVLNEHTKATEVGLYLDPIENSDIGLISEAGVPGIADPGAEIVKIAHKKKIQVVPLTGPSSILLAMMASGLNGQNFAFNGYLPVKQHERISRIRHYEKRAISENQAQIFIETPYRNKQLLDDILTTCLPSTLLCIACNITLPDEFIATRSMDEWKKNIPDLHKKPGIFILGK
jgi:16S rRNA (cytidine1402-2'-O)-methyltransferase